MVVSVRKRKRIYVLVGFYLMMWYIINDVCYKGKLFSITASGGETAHERKNGLHDFPSIDIINIKDEVAFINKKYCGQDDCKFLHVYFHGEQETKANQHFRSFTQLADALNRTMVLTNVGHSRIEACKPFPFEFYYNVEELKKEFPNVRFITQLEFTNWVKERNRVDSKITGKTSLQLSIEHFEILNGGATKESMVRRDENPDLKKFRRLGCFDNIEGLDLRKPKIIKRIMFKKMCIGSRAIDTRKSRKHFSEFPIKSFTSKSNILLIKHKVERALFPIIMPIVPYAEHIITESNMIRKELSPAYIAVHWRMEQATPELLPKCAENLVKALKSIRDSTGVPNVYLATDYPLLSNLSQSSTFREVTRHHQDAMNILRTSVKINTWASLNGMKKIRKDGKHDAEFRGAGVQGILDKLVCVHSNYFVSGPKGCSRVTSSFTKTIANMRQKLIESGDKSLRNVIFKWEG